MATRSSVYNYSVPMLTRKAQAPTLGTPPAAGVRVLRVLIAVPLSDPDATIVMIC